MEGIPGLIEPRTMHDIEETAPEIEDDNHAAQKARQLLMEKSRKQSEACAKAINQVLQSHRCRMAASMIATPEGNKFQIEFIPVD